MERRLSAAMVVAIWGVFNIALIAILVGFTAVRSGPGLDIVLYAASAALVFAVATAVWLIGRRDRHPLTRGLRLPSRPAAALLLAVGVALAWLGLPFGAWLPMVAVVPLVAALAMEIAARRSSSRLSIPQVDVLVTTGQLRQLTQLADDGQPSGYGSCSRRDR